MNLFSSLLLYPPCLRNKGHIVLLWRSAASSQVHSNKGSLYCLCWRNTRLKCITDTGEKHRGSLDFHHGICYIKYRDLKNAFPFNLPQNTHILNVRMLVHLIPNYIYKQNSHCVRESLFSSDIDAQEVKHYNVQYRCNIDDENMQSQWVLFPSSYIHSHTCTMHSLLNPLYKTLLPSWLLKSLLCHGHMTNLQTRRGQI